MGESSAFMLLWKCHGAENSLVTFFHCSEVIGQFITLSKYSAVMAPQTSETIKLMVLWTTLNPLSSVV